MNKSSIEAKAVNRLLAVHRGKGVRKQIRVYRKLGLILTRLKKISNLALQPGTPVDKIRSHMSSDATYHSITIKNGKEKLELLSIKDGELPQTLNELMSGRVLPDSGAFINGGFFVHRKGLRSATSNDCPVGYTIGETKGKVNSLPVPEPWKDVYGEVKDRNGEVLLQSAPVLKKNANYERDIFKYRVVDKSQKPSGELVPNPLNLWAGSLTHCGDANERAAISVGPNNVRFHTLTTKDGKRETGMNMQSWNDVVTSRGSDMAHLNLDGASSLTMGIFSKGGAEIEKISKGGGENVNNDRPIASMLITSPN